MTTVQKAQHGDAWPGLGQPIGWDEQQRLIREANRQRSEWLGAVIRRATAYVRERWLTPLSRRREHQADLRELLALEDRVLADIGLRRADLEAVKHGLVPWEQVFSGRARRTDAGAEVVTLPRPVQPLPASSELDRAA